MDRGRPPQAKRAQTVDIGPAARGSVHGTVGLRWGGLLSLTPAWVQRLTKGGEHMLRWFLFETRPGDRLVWLFERLTGLGLVDLSPES